MRWLAAIVGLLLLAGCRADNHEFPPVVYPPPVPMTVSGVCDDTAVLDRWVMVYSFHVQDFDEYLATAELKSRDDLRRDLPQLNETRNFAAMSEPVPDCARELQTRIFSAMDYALNGLQAYANGNRSDIREVVFESRSRFAALQPGFDALIERLERQYREDHERQG